MRRFLIFALAAPPLAFVMAFWVLPQIANWMKGAPTTIGLPPFEVVPIAYGIGVVPALLTAWVDHALAKHAIAYRIMLTALFAYGLSYALMFAAFPTGFLIGAQGLQFGLIAAVPAALCAWLATERDSLAQA